MAKATAKSKDFPDRENLIITLYVVGAACWALSIVVMSAASFSSAGESWYSQFGSLIGALPFIFLAGGLFSLALGAHNDQKRSWIRKVLIACACVAFLGLGWVVIASFK